MATSWRCGALRRPSIPATPTASGPTTSTSRWPGAAWKALTGRSVPWYALYIMFVCSFRKSYVPSRFHLDEAGLRLMEGANPIITRWRTTLLFSTLFCCTRQATLQNMKNEFSKKLSFVNFNRLATLRSFFRALSLNHHRQGRWLFQTHRVWTSLSSAA